MDYDGHASDPLRFGIPSFEHVALDDIVRLRLNEELYNDLRDSLMRLSHDVAAVGNLGSYDEYSEVVKAAAVDTVLPVQERVAAKIKREKRFSLIKGYGAAGVIGLIINGIASVLPPPGGVLTRTAGNAAQNITRSRVQGKNQSKVSDLEVAHKILVSITDP